MVFYISAASELIYCTRTGTSTVDLAAYRLPKRLTTQVLHRPWSGESDHAPIVLRPLFFPSFQPRFNHIPRGQRRNDTCVQAGTALFADAFPDLISSFNGWRQPTDSRRRKSNSLRHPQTRNRCINRELCTPEFQGSVKESVRC